jgi:2-amino-4-hydroxy-6-hydroxymethyldihydropteridine diphosphokinase
MPLVGLGLGSNLGNRLLNLRTALRRLEEITSGADENGGILTSDVFEAEPWGVTDQPFFLNACLIMSWTLPPEDLLAHLKKIESDMGRTATRRWGERNIDIDILFMDSIIYDSPTLHIPHMDMLLRAFVLIPLAQVAPGWVHPLVKRTVSDIASDFQDCELTRVCSLQRPGMW